MTMFLVGVATTFGVCTLGVLIALWRAPLMGNDAFVPLIKDDTL